MEWTTKKRTNVLANEIFEYFIHKIVAIRSKLAGDLVPHAVSTECATHGSSSSDDVVTLSEFQSLSEEAVRKMAVASMETCALDPFPSSILLLCIEELLPVVTRMVNISLEHGYFADEWKKALVHPLLKKSGLQLINKNFRPVSNLQITSKLTEKAVAVQLQEHMRVNGLFPEVLHQYHSTETALLKVKIDLLMAMDKGQVTLLVLLDYEILLERLRSTVGLRGKVLSWFESYFEDRLQQVSINGTLSKPFDLMCEVSQVSCLGPLLFTFYVSKLFQILKHHLPSVHTYADDTQLYLSFKPSDTFSEVEAVSAMQKCICDVRAWMRQDQPMLNDDKTEFLIIGTCQQLSKISVQSIKVGQAEVSPVVSARNLGT